ncbi:retrovirus-related pol polyprotein from transposon TNT 1-94, partial [Tanacetum coccineum]
MYIVSLKKSENYKAQPYQYASPSKQILKAKAKPFPPCTHYHFNDYRPDDCRNYPECEIYGSYDHFTSGHNRVIHIRGGILDESSQSSESSIGVKCNTCGSTIHSTSDHKEFDYFKRVLDVPQSHISNQALTSSHPVPQDRWSKDQHIELIYIIGDPGEGNGSKQVFKNKKDEHGITTKKIRLVAQGYSQEEGIDCDETFAPLARMEAIRVFLAFATYMNFIVFQMDVKSAFLIGKLKEEVYVKQPPGFESSEFPDDVRKLVKTLYGLKQAPRA